MARIRRPYGSWSLSMLAQLRERQVFKVEAFVAWLAERGIKVDRTLISHWCAGRTHLPADLLVWLARFTGKPDWVFGDYLRAVGYDAVRIPDGYPTEADLVDLILEVGSSLGSLLQATLQARSPDSPGGRAITADERADIAARLDDIIHQLADLRARLKRRDIRQDGDHIAALVPALLDAPSEPDPCVASDPATRPRDELLLITDED